MLSKLDVYKAWVPADCDWARWTKPVSFVNLPPYNGDVIVDPSNACHDNFFDTVAKDTMYIVDLPGIKSIEAGISYIQQGYRPVALYNGVFPNSSAFLVVDTRAIMQGLYVVADVINQSNIRQDAPPVFLLDSNRMDDSSRKPLAFDNRWCVFPQDMPSAAFLIKKGIRKVIVRASNIAVDLTHVLLRYKKQGISIALENERGELEEPKLWTPTFFSSTIYRISVMMGLNRNSAGGFGGVIPDPQESGSRYNGIG